MAVGLSWNHKSVTEFTNIHSGHAHFVTLANGRRVPAPKYAKVQVSGISAYWFVFGPEPVGSGSELIIKPDLLSATKSGYVIDLLTTKLAESQDERTLAAMLARL
ncbi:MAG: hypothetical protein ABSC41_20735 [Acidimicrobiales bacterium]